MTEDDGEVLKARLEEALALADGHGLSLTGVWIAEAINALVAEAGEHRKGPGC